MLIMTNNILRENFQTHLLKVNMNSLLSKRNVTGDFCLYSVSIVSH